jgi:hypothetical protein
MKQRRVSALRNDGSMKHHRVASLRNDVCCLKNDPANMKKRSSTTHVHGGTFPCPFAVAKNDSTVSRHQLAD